MVEGDPIFWTHETLLAQFRPRVLVLEQADCYYMKTLKSYLPLDKAVLSFNFSPFVKPHGATVHIFNGAINKFASGDLSSQLLSFLDPISFLEK